MIADTALSLYYGASAATERTFTSVVSLTEKMMPTVLKTIECWRELITQIEAQLNSKIFVDSSGELKKDNLLVKDYKLTLESVKDSFDLIQEGFFCGLKMLLAIDSYEEIQAIGVYSSDIKSDLSVHELITAPSNIRWKSSLPSPTLHIYGGGTLLMHVLFKIAQILKKHRIYLAPLSSAIPFYEKLGIKRLSTGFMEFVLSSSEQCEKFNEAYQKAFPPPFNDSLLLTDGVERW